MAARSPDTEERAAEAAAALREQLEQADRRAAAAEARAERADQAVAAEGELRGRVVETTRHAKRYTSLAAFERCVAHAAAELLRARRA